MDKMLYLAMTGAKSIMQAQQTNSHNLANANTPGFRADLDSFMSHKLEGPGYEDRVYSLDKGVGSDFQPGAVIQTGNTLDIAMSSGGWMAVQTDDGGEAYTKRGDLKISSVGQLMTGDGRPVMGEGGAITIPPAQKLEIARDGTISIVPLGQDANTLAVIDRIKLVKPEEANLEKGLDGLFRAKDGLTLTADAGVSVQSGALESSNVNSIEALVNMIDYSRAYEMQIKVMAAAQENDQASSKLLRSNG